MDTVFKSNFQVESGKKMGFNICNNLMYYYSIIVEMADCASVPFLQP